MKSGIFVIYFSLGLMTVINGQNYNFKNLRYEDNMIFLANDTGLNAYGRFKFLKFSDSSKNYLSNGGEIRYQFTSFKNENWSPSGGYELPYFFNRYLLHSDLHLGSSFRLFAQLNSTFVAGKTTSVKSIDQNLFDIQQIFAEYHFPFNLNLQIGRQEILLGSQRLVAVREGPNNRLSFDAVRFTFFKYSARFDAFYGMPVHIKLNIFDDKIQTKERLWGLYSVWPMNALNSYLDIYYLGYYNISRTYVSSTERETRHSIGARLSRSKKPLKLDFETLYQFGNFGPQRINAYTISFDGSYTFNFSHSGIELGIKTEAISGDVSAADTQLNTFNPLFPRGAYFGLAALIGPANLYDFHPYLNIDFLNGGSFSVDYDSFFRYSTGDGLYGANGYLDIAILSPHHFIGHQLGFSIELDIAKAVILKPECTFFFPGAYLKDVTPGKIIRFLAVTVQYKY